MGIGYKPRGNYQALLATAVESFLAERTAFFERLSGAPRLEPTAAPAPAPGAVGDLLVAAPERIIVPGTHGKPWLTRGGKKGIDFARRDAENRKLGRLGEQWVLEVEKRRLVEAGRGDLAKKVEWVAETCGDGRLRRAFVPGGGRRGTVPGGEGHGFGEVLPLLRERERGAVLGRPAGEIPPVPGVRLLARREGVRTPGSAVEDAATGGGPVQGVDLRQRLAGFSSMIWSERPRRPPGAT